MKSITQQAAGVRVAMTGQRSRVAVSSTITGYYLRLPSTMPCMYEPSKQVLCISPLTCRPSHGRHGHFGDNRARYIQNLRNLGLYEAARVQKANETAEILLRYHQGLFWSPCEAPQHRTACKRGIPDSNKSPKRVRLSLTEKALSPSDQSTAHRAVIAPASESMQQSQPNNREQGHPLPEDLAPFSGSPAGPNPRLLADGGNHNHTSWGAAPVIASPDQDQPFPTPWLDHEDLLLFTASSANNEYYFGTPGQLSVQNGNVLDTPGFGAPGQPASSRFPLF